MKRLDKKIALVTSATRGIGLACAVKLAKEGAIVYMGVRRLEATQEICDKYAKEGLAMKPVFFDAFDIDSYSTMIDSVVNEEGRIDILVNNYGGGIPDKGWDYIHQLCSNLDGQLLDSSSEVYNGVAEGKYLVGLTFEEAAVTLLREGQHVKIIYMKEGVISTPDGIYLLKGAVHAEEAKEFIDFLTGYDAQYMITQRLGRRSVRIDLLQPNGLPAKKDIHILYANAKQVLESRDDGIAEFDRIFEEESR